MKRTIGLVLGATLSWGEAGAAAAGALASAEASKAEVDAPFDFSIAAGGARGESVVDASAPARILKEARGRAADAKAGPRSVPPPRSPEAGAESCPKWAFWCIDPAERFPLGTLTLGAAAMGFIVGLGVLASNSCPGFFLATAGVGAMIAGTRAASGEKSSSAKAALRIGGAAAFGALGGLLLPGALIAGQLVHTVFRGLETAAERMSRGQRTR